MSNLSQTLAFIRELRSNPYNSEEFGEYYHRVLSPSTHRWCGTLLVDQLEPTVPKSGQVLEVGCGTGLSSVDLARRRPDLTVVATDLNQPMITVGEAAGSPSNVQWQQADAAQLPFQDGHFDAVFSANAVKHFPDPRQGVLEMLRVTKPGGHVLVAELAPWSSWTVGTRLTEGMPLPWLVRPFIARKGLHQSGQLMGSRADVEGWFAGLETAEAHDGIQHLESPPGRQLPFFVVALRRC